MTAFPADIADVYVERVNPANPHQVESRGRWVDTTIVFDPIVIKGQAEAVSVRARVHAARRRGGDRFRAPSGVHRPVERQRARRGGRTGGARARSRADSSAEFPRLARALEDAGRRGRLRGRRRRGRPPGGGAGAHPDRLGRRAAGARMDRRVRVERMAQPRRAAARRRAGAGGFVVSANQNAARSTASTNCSPAPARTRSTISSGSSTTRPRGMPNSSCRCSRGCTRIEARSRRRASSSVQWDRRLAADSSTAALYVFWEEAVLRKLAESRLRARPARRLRGSGRRAGGGADEAVARLVRRRSRRGSRSPVARGARRRGRSRDAPRGRGASSVLGQPAHADLQAPACDFAGGPASIQRRPVRTGRLSPTRCMSSFPRLT